MVEVIQVFDDTVDDVDTVYTCDKRTYRSSINQT